MSSRFGGPTKRYAFYNLPSYSPLGDHSDGAFDEPKADSIIVNFTGDDQSTKDLEKRKGGGGGRAGGGSTGGSRGSGGSTGGNRPSEGGNSAATASTRATTRFNGGTLGSSGVPRPPIRGTRGTGPPIRYKAAAPSRQILQPLGGSLRTGLFIYAYGGHSRADDDDTEFDFCQGAQQLEALKSCASIGGQNGEAFINDAHAQLLMSRDSLDTPESIEHLTAYGERLRTISESDCEIEPSLRDHLREYGKWLGDPDDWLGASLDTQTMCTEQHPELQDTRISAKQREAGTLRGQELGEGILELQKQGNMDGRMGEQTVRDYISGLNSTITKTAARRRSDFTDSKSRQAIVSELDALVEQYLNMDEGQTGYDPDDKFTKAMSGMMNDLREGRDLTKTRYSLKAADLVLNPVVSDAGTSAGNSLESNSRWALAPTAWAASEAIGLGPVSLLSRLG